MTNVGASKIFFDRVVNFWFNDAKQNKTHARMNVINLCDDETDEIPESKKFKVEEKADSGSVPSKDQKVVENSAADASQALHRRPANRRKSELQPMSNNEIEIIEEDDAHELNAYVVADSPNLSLMQKVAELRAHIQIELRKQNLSPLSFDQEQKVDSLIKQYNAKLARK